MGIDELDWNFFHETTERLNLEAIFENSESKLQPAITLEIESMDNEWP